MYNIMVLYILRHERREIDMCDFFAGHVHWMVVAAVDTPFDVVRHNTLVDSLKRAGPPHGDDGEQVVDVDMAAAIEIGATLGVFWTVAPGGDDSQ